jgi:lysophospholipase L1-like esterase
MKNALVAALGLAVSLLLAECALRVLGMYSPPPWPPVQVSPGYYVPDAAVGYRLYPSARTCLRYPEEGGALFEVISNSDGFRASRDFTGADARRRIAVLGDSFVFGLGVEEAERFTNVLETQLQGWRVDNLGMSGWGPAEMVRVLEALGPKLKPDVVVLSMYTHDFVRLNPQYAGMGFATSQFALAGGALVDRPFVPPVGWRRARLWQAWLDVGARLDPNHLALNEALFGRFRTSTLALGAKPVALFLPGRADGVQDRLRRDLLRDWAARAGVPFGDLTAAIHGPGLDRTMLPDNAHWTPAGHRAAAVALADVLVEAGIVSASAPPPPLAARPRSFCHDSLIEGPEPAAAEPAAGRPPPAP